MSGGGHGGGRRKKHAVHEEHENHERWLVSYADMVTLLMVLFIVLFAISQVDQKKFMALAQGLSASFGGPVRVTEGSEGILPDSSSASIVAFDPRATFNVRPNPGVDLTEELVTGLTANPGDKPEAGSALERALRENAQLDEAQRQIQAGLKEAGFEQKVRFVRDERGLTVTVVTDKIVFPADDSGLTTAGDRIISTIGSSLAALPNQIAVEGHTNQAPVRPENYVDEWELSSERAGSVLRQLLADGVAPKRLRAIGYGDTRPLLDPSDPRALEANRRVDIVVLSQFASPSDAAPPSVAGSPLDRPVIAGPL